MYEIIHQNKNGSCLLSIIVYVMLQDRIYPHIIELKEKAISYLEQRWGTKRLPIPQNMVAPYMQMILLPYIKPYSDDPSVSS